MRGERSWTEPRRCCSFGRVSQLGCSHVERAIRRCVCIAGNTVAFLFCTPETPQNTENTPEAHAQRTRYRIHSPETPEALQPPRRAPARCVYCIAGNAVAFVVRSGRSGPRVPGEHGEGTRCIHSALGSS